MDDEVLERNKNLNRGFRKLRVWREAVEGISFKIKDQIISRAKAQRRKV